MITFRTTCCKFFIALLLTFTTLLHAAETERSSSTTWLPILYYTPETKFAFGGLVNYNFYTSASDSISFPSSFLGDIIYTINKQWIVESLADIYRGNGEYHFNGRICYRFYPDKFYGIGRNTSDDDEEDFTSKIFELELFFQKKIYKVIDIGIQYVAKYNHITGYDDSGILKSKTLTGSEKGFASGIGPLLTLDTRDNKYYPTKGMYHELNYLHFGNSIGSDYKFDSYLLNIRNYFELPWNHIAAFQLYLNIIGGDPPFQLMPQLGGQNIMRGYFTGRYRDRNMLAFQSEYRLGIWKNLGLNLFASAGDVSNHFHGFMISKLKLIYGAGLRYFLNEKEKINLRLDYALASNSSGIYITIGEAF